MIFNNEFDESLRLIVRNDKKVGIKILKFIRELPEELGKSLNEKLVKYEEYREKGFNNGEIEYCLMGNYSCNNYHYLFIIDMVENSLTIVKNEFSASGFKKIFEIVLNAKTGYNNIDAFGKQILGKINDGYLDSSIQYSLVDTMFGRMVVSSNNNGIKKYRKNIEDSDILDLDNIDDINKKKNIRKRKIGK